MLQTNHESRRKGIALFFSVPILSWALYDFANTIFASNIMTIFFPFFIQDALGGNERLDQIASTFISYANALASLFLVLLSPLYGVWMDRSGRIKKFLIPFAWIAIVCTILMGVTAMSNTEQQLFGLPLTLGIVLILFIIAKFSFQSSLVFYDTMISGLGNAREIPLISGFGVAVGYCGTLAGLSVYPFLDGDRYGLVFLLSGLLFLVFSLPLMFLSKDQPRARTEKPQKLGFFSGYKEIIATFKEAKTYRPIFLFMIAFFFFNDAISTTIAMMSIYAATVFGFSTKQFILLYLVATIFAIIGSFIFGYITRRVGAKRAVLFVASLLIVALLLGVFSTSQVVFWVAAALYGVALGSIWVTSRTLIVQLTPPEKRGQFFGMFAFSGKVSAIVGPLIYGTITWALADTGAFASRIALGSLTIFVLIGIIFHFRVPYEKVEAE